MSLSDYCLVKKQTMTAIANAIRVRTEQSSGGGGGGGTYEITVYAPSGSAVTATKSGTTYNSEVITTGTYKIEVPEPGEYTVTATKGTGTASQIVLVEQTAVKLNPVSGTNVFGLLWNYGNSSTELERLTPETDPLGVVNVTVDAEPTPGIGGVSGSSFFDDYAPWKEMEEYNIVNGAVAYKRGENGFSRTNYDTMVYIPEFYYRVIDVPSTNSRYFYVSNGAIAGFSKHPGSGRYVGRYDTASGYVSKSGAVPIVNITRSAARTGSKGKGAGWYQYDYATWCAIWLLYLVEYADWNSQSAVGQGIVNMSERQNNGKTDAMVYHTGRDDGTDGQTAVQYRHIENPWGNVFQWVDGININNYAVYLCDDPEKYADDTYDNYTSTGVSLTTSSGYINKIAAAEDFMWAFLPTYTGGSTTTYIPDYVYTANAWRVLYVGGYWYCSGYAGLFCFYAGSASSYADAGIGARLLFIP